MALPMFSFQDVIDGLSPAPHPLEHLSDQAEVECGVWNQGQDPVQERTGEIFLAGNVGEDGFIFGAQGLPQALPAGWIGLL